ncbi:MAG: VOC family protein [Polyangiales bacterium]
MTAKNDVLGLAYFVFEAKDTVGWRKLLVDALGMTEGRTFDDGTTAYRMDERAGRIFVRPGDADDLVALGFEAASKNAMWDVAMRARDAGAFVEEGLAKDAAGRFAAGLVRFEEPGGVSIEVVHGVENASDPLDTSRCQGGFVTEEQGVGHLALRANDVDESQKFFETILGFRLSDHIRCELVGGFKVDVTFLHVNKRHHTVALGKGLPKHLDHFMIQAKSLDDFGRIYDRCFDVGVKVTQTMGRHPNDRMMSFYGLTPSGFQFECGYGGREIDDATWVPETYDRISIWGHRRPGSMKNLHTS